MKINTQITGFITGIFAPIRWIADSFTEKDGKASGSRLTAWFLTMLCGYYIYADKIKDSYNLYAFVAMLSSILLIWGVITWKDIETVLTHKKKE